MSVEILPHEHKLRTVTGIDKLKVLRPYRVQDSKKSIKVNRGDLVVRMPSSTFWNVTEHTMYELHEVTNYVVFVETN